MAFATDLMGLGLPAQVAARVSADNGAGVTSVTAAGNTFATGTALKAGRRVVTCSNGNNTLALSLPSVTSGGAHIGDELTIVNTGTDSVAIWASSGVTISASGSNTSFAFVPVGKALRLFPLSTTAWCGIG